MAKNIQSLWGAEKIFYKDQKALRKCRISKEEHIDFETEYEIFKLQRIQNEEKQKINYILLVKIWDKQMWSILRKSIQIKVSEINLNKSSNHSGKIWGTIQKFDIALQTVQVQLERPQLRIKKRVCKDEIKAAYANLSSQFR